MSVQRIASRYAKSLLDLVIERNEVEAVLNDMKSFKKASENRDLYLLLKSPIINGDKKMQVFNAIFGDSFSPTTTGFIKIVLNKGREAYLPDIATEFEKQYQQMKHISTIKLTTAANLEDAELEEIKKRLLASPVTDENLEVITKVDPALIGGFVIEFDDKRYDSSVAHKLDTLKKEFSENLYVKKI